MNGFAGKKPKYPSPHANFLRVHAYEMHLDSAFHLIKEGAVFECLEIKIRSEFAIDPLKNIEVESRSYAPGVVVRIGEDTAILHQVHPYYQNCIFVEHVPDMLQQTTGFVRFEIANCRSRKKPTLGKEEIPSGKRNRLVKSQTVG